MRPRHRSPRRSRSRSHSNSRNQQYEAGSPMRSAPRSQLQPELEGTEAMAEDTPWPGHTPKRVIQPHQLLVRSPQAEHTPTLQRKSPVIGPAGGTPWFEKRTSKARGSPSPKRYSEANDYRAAPRRASHSPRARNEMVLLDRTTSIESELFTRPRTSTPRSQLQPELECQGSTILMPEDTAWPDADPTDSKWSLHRTRSDSHSPAMKMKRHSTGVRFAPETPAERINSTMSRLSISPPPRRSRAPTPARRRRSRSSTTSPKPKSTHNAGPFPPQTFEMTTKFALRYNTGLAEPSIEPTQIVLDGRLIWKAGAASPARYDASANNPPALTFHPDRLIFTTVSVADLCVVLGTNENCSVIVRIDPVNLTSLSALSALLHPGQSNIFTLVAPEGSSEDEMHGEIHLEWVTAMADDADGQVDWKPDPSSLVRRRVIPFTYRP